MRLFEAPLEEHVDYMKAKNALSVKGESVSFFGCAESQKLHMFCGLSEATDYKLIITYSEIKAREILLEQSIYDNNVMYFPAKDLIFYQADVFGNKIVAERMKVLRSILTQDKLTVVTTIDALATPLVPVEILKNKILTVSVKSVVSEKAISIKLRKMGYQKVDAVDAPGQFAIHGGIIDVFDLTIQNPVRIELWGDDVESIRSFDVGSQRSIEKLKSVTIFPAKEMIVSEDTLAEGLKAITKEAQKQSSAYRKAMKTEESHRIDVNLRQLKEGLDICPDDVNLESYIKYLYPEAGNFLDLFDRDKTMLLIDEPAKCDLHEVAIEAEFTDAISRRIELGQALSKQGDIILSKEELFNNIRKFRYVATTNVDFASTQLDTANQYNLGTRSISSYNGSVTELLRDLKKYKENGYRVLVMSGSRTRAKRLATNITEEGVNAFYSDNLNRVLNPGEVMTYYGHLNQGFEYVSIKYVLLSDTDIFGKERKRSKKKRYSGGTAIKDITELSVGDYVVHESYGVGIYKGIEKLTSDNVSRDYMKIEYAGNSNLYVLASSFDLIAKYASADAKKPKLNKLGSSEWEKTKSKVQQAVEGVAEELVELYAKRQQTNGFTYSPDTPWQKEFEELFPYDETDDQLAAIEATKKDMESSKIMERLICGDVGFGKTEIAIRAAFKAVMDGKQVVYLVPTTILAGQHYSTFVERMKDYPVKIELLCRFKSSKDQRKTVDNLKKGLVDIVIGTHRLLSKDVEIANLGLLIIDEEQRFGVAHKEKIKKLRENVDVLALSATPIPRTLHMSLVGIRDMSLLEEAPQDRMPIQTFVMEQDEEMVREAIVRELARGGQVYYVHNRVNDIDMVADKIRKLVPEAKVAYAHGQMNETELEDIMYGFINGETNVLVSTTIIETGLDISNVNTIIISDADRFGMAQLYQLRGRVGRSNRTAYAFLMYRKDRILSDVAEKRLAAIREFTELGSGFKISMRDLELRGAGNVLGKKQHGHMEAVGYELYCKMLNTAVGRLKGIEVEEKFEPRMDLGVDAFIPDEYTVNEIQKLDIYQRIASIEGPTDYEEMTEELVDRFGSLPRSAENLLKVALLKARANKLYVTEIVANPGKIMVYLKPDAKINVDNIPEFLMGYREKIRFINGSKPGFEIKYEKSDIIQKNEEMLLKKIEDFLCNAELLLKQ